MCGRYALHLRPSEIRRRLQDDNMAAFEAPPDPPDDDDDGGGGGGGGGGPGGPRQSFNFAPGYYGVVYRADVPDWGAGSESQSQHGDRGPQDDLDKSHYEGADDALDTDSGNEKETRYKLQSMKWGLIPFWTKRNPGYGGLMKTINCRAESLAQGGGMWSSMKGKKRCVVVAEGFYEWLKKDGGRGKDKVPHFVKRKDGKLMCFAGLWDAVAFEDDETKQTLYTYTIITTESNKQLSFLHDRMPVILDNGSEDLRTWLDPKRHEWSNELQSLLKPFDGELEVYPVSQDVGKVGNNRPDFVLPVDSKENKRNIANFFSGAGAMKEAKHETKEEKHMKEEDEEKPQIQEKNKNEKKIKTEQPEIAITKDEGFVAEDDMLIKTEKHDDGNGLSGTKRKAYEEPDEKPAKKKPAAVTPHGKGVSPSTTTSSGRKPSQVKGRQKISATSNGTQIPEKKNGEQKITRFFGNSS
ncbi:hypothetical protein GGR57DRAFT_73754 [Xylariaceae sp. FL1272]|nr:hypothetical protein GGR57DRAFT_73754 [Xylariaceae sp. FL1272]